MKANKLPAFTSSYLLALRQHLSEDSELKSIAAKELGLRAVADGLATLDLAKVHEEALVTIVAPNEAASVRETLTRSAGQFFAEAITPIELMHRGAREGNASLTDAVGKLTQRTKELAESNEELIHEIDRRKTVEESLRTSEQTSSQLLAESCQLQEELRLLSRRLLVVQEEERKRISRELHDLIGQTLAGINLQLMVLKSKACSDLKELHKNIERTQKLVEKSVATVHRFAFNLRPALLDDLGLIAALQSYLKEFMETTGIRVTLTAFADVEKVGNVERTVLYRVAQEALSNVAQHAKASLTEVRIFQRNDAVCMEIRDNGEGFDVGDGILMSTHSKRLGLLGMRERVEMVGGSFSVQSTLGKETTVSVEIPRSDPAPKKPRGKKSTKNTLKSL